MDSDRNAALTVRAAAEGLVDFRQARILDPRWWRRVRIVTDALERKTRAAATHARFDYHRAIVANSGLTKESFESQQQELQEVFYDLVGCHRPWEGKSYLHRKRKEFGDWRQDYIDAFGVDPADPAFKAWEAAQVEKLLSGELDGPAVEEDDERVRRLIEEREIAGTGRR